MEGNVYVLEWCCELFFSELSLYQPTSRIKGPKWVPDNSELKIEVRFLQLPIHDYTNIFDYEKCTKTLCYKSESFDIWPNI